jgi:death on curing protein
VSAVLAHGIAEAQAFVDGNKRLALIAMRTFLEINGYELPVSDPELAAWISGLASGTTSSELAARLCEVMIPLD